MKIIINLLVQEKLLNFLKNRIKIIRRIFYGNYGKKSIYDRAIL